MGIAEDIVGFFNLFSNMDLLPSGLGSWNIISVCLFCIIVGVIYGHLRSNNPKKRSRLYHFSVVFLFAWAFQVFANDLLALIMAAAYNGNTSNLLWPVNLQTLIGLPLVIDIRIFWIIFAAGCLIYCYRMEKENLTWGLAWLAILVQIIVQSVFLSTGLMVQRAYPPDSYLRALVFWAFYVPPYFVYAISVLSIWKINIFSRAGTLLKPYINIQPMRVLKLSFFKKLSSQNIRIFICIIGGFTGVLLAGLLMWGASLGLSHFPVSLLGISGALGGFGWGFFAPKRIRINVILAVLFGLLAMLLGIIMSYSAPIVVGYYENDGLQSPIFLWANIAFEDFLSHELFTSAGLFFFGLGLALAYLGGTYQMQKKWQSLFNVPIDSPSQKI